MLRRLLFAVRSAAVSTATATVSTATATTAAEYENKDNDPPATAKSTTVHK